MSRKIIQCLVVLFTIIFFVMCRNPYEDDPPPQDPGHAIVTDLQIDPATGIPYAMTFQHPIPSFDASDYGFGFAQENTNFCERVNAAKQCTAYGYHLGRDTIPSKTRVGTAVFAPADGIVRITTDVKFGGLGSDNKRNPDERGCAIVLEHLLKNGQPITTLLEHVLCESDTRYDASQRVGNPAKDLIVRRGQYLAHVAHYWHGADTSIDWHHLHWGIRKGRFHPKAYERSALAAWIQGYAPRSEFTSDPSTGALVHPIWLDPFLVVAANGDPVAQASASVRFHPSGSLLQDPHGQFWIVENAKDIKAVPSEIMISDRYDAAGAVRVTDDEINCYHQTGSVAPLGGAVVYVRPGTHTVVMAYERSHGRYDVIRWEALLSWGYDDADLKASISASTDESSYHPLGFRLLRPGSLVKADNASEVSIVTQQQTRLPIASSDVFEQAGFRWERIITLPGSVLDAVAGVREDHVLTLDDLHVCTIAPACPGGTPSCGGGAEESEAIGDSCGTDLDCEGDLICEAWRCVSPAIDGSGGKTEIDQSPRTPSQPETPGDVIETSSDSMPLHLLFQSPTTGPLSIQGWWQAADGSTRSWTIIPCLDLDQSDDLLECDLPVPRGARQFEFQVYLPHAHYWGDISCDPTGGCGNPQGTLVMSIGNTVIPVSLVSNGTGPLYDNGRIAPVP